MSTTPSVEVKCLDTFAYYPAFLRDYDGSSQVLVSYPNAWKNDEWVLLENVRNGPAEFDPASFNPQVGDCIEVQAKSSDDEPYSWWKATVKSVRGEFYMISYSCWEDEYNEILEKEMLRPFNKNPSLKAADIRKLELPLPKDLRESVSLHAALNNVLQNIGVLSVYIDQKKQMLIILGNTVSVKRAQVLASMAFKHLGDIQRLNERKMKHQSQLDSMKQRLNEGHLETFVVQPPELISLVIGTGGTNLRRVQKMPGVLTVTVDSSKNQVTILAKTSEEAKAAREQLEFFERRFPIQRNQVGRVVGKSFSNIDQIKKDSGVVRLRLDNDKSTDDPNSTVDLIIIGTKDTVEDAVLLLEHHMEFLNSVNQLSVEERQLSDEVRKLNLESGSYEGGETGRPYARSGMSSRGARGPRPQGNRQYSGGQADFPPLPAARKPNAPVTSEDDERKESASAPRSGRAGGRGGRSGRTGSQSARGPSDESRHTAFAGLAASHTQSTTPAVAASSEQSAGSASSSSQSQRRERTKKEPRANNGSAAPATAAAAASSSTDTSAAASTTPAGVTAAASPTSGDETARRNGRGVGRGGRSRREPRQSRESKEETSVPAASPITGSESAAAAVASPASSPVATVAGGLPPREKKERAPRQPRQPREPRGDKPVASSETAPEAASSPQSSPDAASGSSNNASRPKKPRQERRPKQPASDPNAPAPAASSPTPAASAQ